MGFCKRILILSDKQHDDKRGYLTLQQNGTVAFGNLKVFNVAPKDDFLLVLSLNNRILSNIVIKKEDINNFNFELNKKIDISNNIDSLLVYKSDVSPVLFGSTDVDRAEVYEALKLKAKEFNGLGVSPAIDKGVKPNPFKKQEKEDIDEKIDENLFIDDEVELNEQIETELQKDTIIFNENQASTPPFFNLVKEQVDEMFSTYPEFEKLESLIMDSRWVKVDYDSSGLFYGLGLIYEGDDVKYICYAVPAENNFQPPSHLEEYCQWLPENDDDRNGYYIMYQDAVNGTNIKL